MSGRTWIAMGMCVALCAGVASAQMDQKPAESYIYATYFECPTNDQWLADRMLEAAAQEVWDGAVEAGRITGWGWLAHNTGGKWRRALYFTAPSLDALVDAGGINDDAAQKDPRAAMKMQQVCPAHVDYIWHRKAGSPPGGSRGAFGFSVYYVCDIGKESRADEIVAEDLAPIFDRQVASGALKSWGWNEHIVGGKYRRLETMTGDDEKALLAARGAIIEEIVQKHQEVGDEFDAICGPHEDYIWEIVHETP